MYWYPKKNLHSNKNKHENKMQNVWERDREEMN
jgi:hypothetical protein